MPEKIRISVRNRTFPQRLRSAALWWGIPAVCLELIGVPRDLWLYALIFIIPATAAGVVTEAAILHAFMAHPSKSSDEGKAAN
jgi:hypothetical protein